MSVAREDIDAALVAFRASIELAGVNDASLSRELTYEFQAAPHTRPRSLPIGKAAVYGFFDQSGWLKIGKVGPNSNQRYAYQHYKPGSAQSTLAGSLIADPRSGADKLDIENWICRNTGRVNILAHKRFGEHFLSFLESFFILRFKPRYEGQAWQ
jgi:hypothetical protein